MTEESEVFLISYWGKRVTVEHRLAGGTLTWSTQAEQFSVPCVRRTVGSHVTVYTFDKGRGNTLIHAVLVIDWTSNEAFYSGFPGPESAQGGPDIDRGAVRSKQWIAAASAFPRSEALPSDPQGTPPSRVFTSRTGTHVQLKAEAPTVVVLSPDGSRASFSPA